MKRLRAFLITIALYLVLMPITASIGSQIDEEAAAREVLLLYFNALSQGDVGTLRSLMGGALLEKRSRLLDNPTYPAHLVKTYGAARFVINKIETLGTADIAIDASIISTPDEVLKRRYLLRKEMAPDSGSTYHLYGEIDPNLAP
jgi:hypothetical protein